MLISLVLMMVALFLAADLIREAGTLLVDTAREVPDSPASLVLSRLRADIMAASDADGPLGWSEGPLNLFGSFGKVEGIEVRSVRYERDGTKLYRSLFDEAGYPLVDQAVVWNGITDWAWRRWGAMVEVDVSYRRFAVPRSPLPNLPRYRGRRSELVHENLLVVPRGGGLGYRW
jgi:hypothetical protein